MTTTGDAPLLPSARRLGLRFALTYAAIAAVSFAVYAFPFELFGAERDWLAGYLAAYAQLAGGALAIVEPDVVVSGAVIHGRFPLEIVRNCDAIELNILFASAVLALPVRWRPKLIALLAGMASLVALNVLRICSLYYLGISSRSAFELAHEEIFPLVLVAATAALFLVCVTRLDLAERSQVASDA